MAEFLVSQGHLVVKPAAGTPDAAVAAKAKQEERILLTHDVGFSNIFLFPPHEYAGIVVIRIIPPSLNIMLNALKNLLTTLDEGEFSNKLIILEPVRFRIYKEGESNW